MRILYFVLLIICLSILDGCTKTENDSQNAQICFLLTDTPVQYQEVNIDIQSMEIIINDSIIELATNQGVYNILEFVNGKDTVLVSDDIPTGNLSQIRLVLGENNTVMIDSIYIDLQTPSAYTSGLKLNVHTEFVPGLTYTYIVDFEANKSIVKTGNGDYILKPVIRIFTEAITGGLKGIVQPVEANPLIQAINQDDTTATIADAETGEFIIRGLPEGYYQVEFLSGEGFRDTILTDIEIQAGQITLMDTLWLN